MSDTKAPWHPGRILGLSGAYWQSCALHAAVKLDLFSVLLDSTLSADNVAKQVNGDADALARLMDALTAMGLLRKSGTHYANAEHSRRYLAKNSSEYIGFMILHHRQLMASWQRLDEAVLSGRPIPERSSDSSDPDWRENFLMGMFNNAMQMAPQLVQAIDIHGRRHLLDMGGGPGTYAIHFCQYNPDLRATVYDLPTTEPFALKTIARFGLSDRIDFQPGDYTSGVIEGRYDAVWMSHILHGEDAGTCREMIAKAVAVAKPGARVMIHEFILDDERDGPLFPALFSLNMLLGTEGGRAYTQQELYDMMSEAGIEKLERHPFLGPTESGVVMGRVTG
jgi:hypothetical protein